MSCTKCTFVPVFDSIPYTSITHRDTPYIRTFEVATRPTPLRPLGLVATPQHFPLLNKNKIPSVLLV